MKEGKDAPTRATAHGDARRIMEASPAAVKVDPIVNAKPEGILVSC